MQDLTTGSVTRHLLKTTSFMLVTMVFQTLYFLIDLYWVGRLGRDAVAGVGVAGNLMFLTLAATQMLGVGATTMVSHAVGRKDRDRALRVFNQAIVLSAVIGFVFLVLSMSLRMAYARALSADAETARRAGDYLLWFLPATALQFPMVAMSSALRGTGNFRPGMLVQSATIILNMILAPFLIFGWIGHHPMGVAGAALATFIAIALGTAWLVTFFFDAKSFLRFVRADWKPDLPLWGSMLKIGLPAGAEFALLAVYLFVVYAISKPFGAAAQAGFGIGQRIVQAGFMPVVALGFAVAPVAGQNFGARHPERVRETFRSAVRLSVMVMALFAVLCHIAPAAMVAIFSSDPQVVAVGDEYLRLISWNYVASGVVFVASSMFQALGNTVPSLISSFVRVALVAFPAITLSRLAGFQLHWIWYLAIAAVTIQMMLSLWLLRREMRAKLAFAPPPASLPVAPPLVEELSEPVVG